jgi:hypothetical protein
MATTCRDDVEDYTYTFQEKIDLYPAQKSYKVGDTIWIQYSNPTKRLFDQKTSQTVSADTVSITFAVGYNAKYGYPTINPSDGFCDFISMNGVNEGRYLGDYGTSMLQTFGCENNNGYDFNIAVVPKQKGIYSLNLNGVPRTVAACSNRISGFPFSTIDYSYDLADCNKDVFLSIPPNSRSEARGAKGTQEAEIDQKKVYYLKVD